MQAHLEKLEAEGALAGSSWSSESRAALEFPGCSDGHR